MLCNYCTLQHCNNSGLRMIVGPYIYSLPLHIVEVEIPQILHAPQSEWTTQVLIPVGIITHTLSLGP